MNFPWEAVVTLVISVVGLIIALTKISVMQDVGNEKLRGIESKVTLIESTYAKNGDFSWLKERVETGFKDLNEKVEKLRTQNEKT